MAEEKSSPISAVKPPVSNPLKPAAAEHASTLKLKPVIRKPTLGGGAAPGVGAKLPVKPITRSGAEEAPAPAPAAPAPAAEAAPKAMDQLKSVTQRLKDVTQEIPQQAILRKTGIIGEQELTAAQKQAAKARTARISLSDAMGVAPVKEAAPMKTIRIKRPVDLPATAPAAAAPEPATLAPVDAAPTEPTEPAQNLTQRKTLKISRPGSMRPPSKLGIKKPGAPAPAEPAAEGDVADIPDIPEMPVNVPAFAPPSAPAASDVPKGVSIVSLVVQVAACAVMGVALYWLSNDWQLPNF